MVRRDYGGKTREQEARDSTRMLGCSLILLLGVLIGLGAYAVLPLAEEQPQAVGPAPGDDLVGEGDASDAEPRRPG